MSGDLDILTGEGFLPGDNYDRLSSDQKVDALVADMRRVRQQQHKFRNVFTAWGPRLDGIEKDAVAEKERHGAMHDKLDALHEDGVRTRFLLKILAWEVPILVALATLLLKVTEHR